jgi:hypothetical protein
MVALVYCIRIVTRTTIAIATMIGVLLMSMPGGMCFFFLGIGVDHHHHAVEEAATETCFHDHGHACADHGHDPEVPQEPCDPAEDGADVLAFAALLKVDPAALPPVADFVPDWAVAPELLFEASVSKLDAFVRIDAPPPPAAVRFCRFLI